MWQAAAAWTFHVIYTLDLFLNALIKGSPLETISSRCYRLDYIWQYRVCEIALNAIARPFVGPEHCKQSYLNLVEGTYLPKGFFDKAVYDKVMDDANAMNARFDKSHNF